MAERAKVLIADDEQACIELVREALADEDCQVLSAMDGEEALATAKKEVPQVLILDVQMPKMNGFEVFRQLRADESLSAVRVIMLTAVTQRTGIKFSGADMGEYLGSEPDAYIDKPIEPVILRQAVRRLLKGRAGSA